MVYYWAWSNKTHDEGLQGDGWAVIYCDGKTAVLHWALPAKDPAGRSGRTSTEIEICYLRKHLQTVHACPQNFKFFNTLPLCRHLVLMFSIESTQPPLPYLHLGNFLPVQTYVDGPLHQFCNTVDIGYCDYHPVTNIGYCDYLSTLIWFSDRTVYNTLCQIWILWPFWPGPRVVTISDT